jgi:hypothetical protein
VKRPSARFNGPGHLVAAVEAQERVTCEQVREYLHARSLERAQLRRQHRQLAIEWLRNHDEGYSTDLARAFGWRDSYAAVVLRVLEREGALTSEHRPSPVSGNGRRYFRMMAAS